MTEKVDLPQVWRSRAEETRAVADTMKDAKSKAIMIRIAEDYERTAKTLQRILGDHSS